MSQEAVRTGFTSRLIMLTTLVAVMGFGLEGAARASLGPVVTEQVQDINPGPDDGNPLQGRGGIDFGGDLLFAATDGYTGASHADELWRSDGTDAGTFLVKDIADLGPNFSSSPDWMTEVGGEVFFSASSGSLEGTELWKTDGTGAGTVLVKNINATNFFSSGPSDLTNVNGTLYFLANSDDTDGQELWKSDGTPGGTVMVEDLQTSITPVFNLTAAGNRLFFTRKTASEGKELWTSDGTAPGTTLVENIGPGAADGLPVPFTPQLESDYIDFGGILYFRANDGVNGLELWRSDGTALGTSMVKDINGNAGSSMSFGASFAASGGELFFAWDFGLQKTDGTGPGTVPVGTGVGNTPTELVDVDGTIFFEGSGTRLWKSDGTTPGTQEVFDAGVALFDLMAFDGNVYFSYDNGIDGLELYRSDGTIGAPERLTDINAGAGDSLVNGRVVVGDRLYLRGDDDGVATTGTGVELWSVHADRTAPQTTIDSGPSEGETIEVDTATFTFSADEPGSTFTCSLDGGAPAPCDSGTSTYAGLTEGTHTFSVAATDPPPFSNVETTPAIRTFTYAVPVDVVTPPADTAAPKLRLRGGKKQANRRRLVVKATCLDEACSLRATGSIKVKIFRRNGKVKKTRKLKLKKATASREAGTQVTLRLKIGKKARRLVGRSLKRKKIPKARIKVRAADSAGNTRTRGRTVKIIAKKRFRAAAL